MPIITCPLTTGIFLRIAIEASLEQWKGEKSKLPFWRIINEKNPLLKALSGFKPSQPVVFCGIFPLDAGDFKRLRNSVEKLSLNDSSFIFEPIVMTNKRYYIKLKLTRNLIKLKSQFCF